MIPILGMLASAGLDLVKDFVEAGKDKAAEVIKEKTGIDLTKTKKLTPQDIQKLKEFQEKNREFLIKQLELITKDKQNAREMRIETLTSDKTPLFSKIFPDVLAGVTVIATFVLFYIFASGRISTEQKDIILYILGMLSGITATIYAFYFGSSKGSQEKTQLLGKKNG